MGILKPSMFSGWLDLSPERDANQRHVKNFCALYRGPSPNVMVNLKEIKLGRRISQISVADFSQIPKDFQEPWLLYVQMLVSTLNFSIIRV
jgi:hypothetical protein